MVAPSDSDESRTHSPLENPQRPQEAQKVHRHRCQSQLKGHLHQQLLQAGARLQDRLRPLRLVLWSLQAWELIPLMEEQC